ncbi:TRAP transporter permease [Bacillus tianshenii]|nr:TRAP transporter permease [Bacillus tianshenii]
MNTNQNSHKEAQQEDKKINIEIEKELTYVDRLWMERKEGWNRTRLLMLVIVLLSIGLSVFHIYTAGFGTLPSWHQRSIHVIWGILLIFLLFPSGKNGKMNWLDILLIIVTLATSFYILTGYPKVEMRQGNPNNNDILFGSILMVLVLEATRRTNGIFMSAIALFFILYVFLGPYFPGALAHPGVQYSTMISNMFNGTIGIFSAPIYVSSTVLILFVIFGAFLIRSGGGQAFTSFAFGSFGSKTGGPALAGVGASALMGTITGNGSSNAAITGAFTIPLMKKLGYSPKFAGAVEAVASQGGQIMPPIMGASVFIMAETTGIPYIKLALYGIVPAVIYFLITGFVIYFHAKSLSLAGIPKEQLPSVRMVLLKQGYLFLPIVLIIVMMIQGFSPMKAGFYAILASLFVSWLRKATRMNLLDILSALEKGAKGALSVMAACAAAGIIVGAVSLTGLGMNFSRFIVNVSGQSLFLLLILTAVTSIILGMGMPTVSAYVILAVLGVPALMNLGVNEVAAHFFVFYFGIISGITPPVAITAFITAGIANSPPMRTAFYALRVGLGGFIVPFIFVYNPALLLQGESPMHIVLAIVTALVSCYGFAIAVENYWLAKLTIFSRILVAASSIVLIIPGIYSDVIGIGGLAVAYILQKKMIKTTLRESTNM